MGDDLVGGGEGGGVQEATVLQRRKSDNFLANKVFKQSVNESSYVLSSCWPLMEDECSLRLIIIVSGW